MGMEGLGGGGGKEAGWRVLPHWTGLDGYPHVGCMSFRWHRHRHSQSQRRCAAVPSDAAGACRKSREMLFPNQMNGNRVG